MRLLAAGVNHKSAPIEVRERLALHPRRQVDALRNLLALPGVAEALVLSTCNRFELYVAGPACASGTNVGQLVQRVTSVPPQDVQDQLYEYHDRLAAQHLFEVASGADSMVVGECEIVAQVKEAADTARNAGTLGAVLSRLAESALQAGKQARNETTIDRGCASVASVSVSLTQQICGKPSETTALLIGAGETAELTLQRLADSGTQRIFIANRTAESARRLARTCGGVVRGFDEIYEAMVDADVVLTSTSAPHAVVHVEQMRQVVRDRGARPLFIIDLAVPRDAEPAIGELENVFLYNIDSLQEAVDEALKERESQLPQVQAICRGAAEEFWAWASSLDLVPTMLQLREKAESVRRQEFDRALRHLGPLNAKQQKQLHILTKRLVQGIIDEPLNRLRSRARDGDSLAYLHALRDLFGLEAVEPGEFSADTSDTEGDEA